MPVEFRHIRAFRAVAETLSFCRASKRLGVAQPALSRTIRKLEEDLKTELFTRTTRVTRLTESGRTFFNHTTNLVTDLERAIDMTQRTHNGMIGQIRVGFNDWVITDLVPQVVRGFRSVIPNVEVVLMDESTPQAIEMVLDDECDVAFIVDQELPDELDCLIVREEPVVCVLPTGHSLTEKESISIKDLAEEPFVMGRWDTWKTHSRPIRSFCIAHGFSPRVIQEADHSDGIIGLVAAEVGVTLHVDSAWIRTINGITVRTINEQPPRFKTSAIWHRDRNKDASALESFIESVRAVTEEEYQA